MNGRQKKGTKSIGKPAGKEKETSTEKKVEFSFHAPDAVEVYLAGEFNQWDTCSLPMKKGKDGIWRAMIKLPSGRYQYKLFADDEWVEVPCNVAVEGTPMADTYQTEMASNPFGTQNFVFYV